jgi:hypothetical protein
MPSVIMLIVTIKITMLSIIKQHITFMYFTSAIMQLVTIKLTVLSVTKQQNNT